MDIDSEYKVEFSQSCKDTIDENKKTVYISKMFYGGQDYLK